MKMAKKKTVKKSEKKKNKPKNKMKKGSKYTCSVCGLIVSIDECGCLDVSDLVCCSKPMKPKTTTKKAKKTK